MCVRPGDGFVERGGEAGAREKSVYQTGRWICREGRGGWGKMEECVSDREMDLWRGKGRLGKREECVSDREMDLWRVEAGARERSASDREMDL